MPFAPQIDVASPLPECDTANACLPPALSSMEQERMRGCRTKILITAKSILSFLEKACLKLAGLSTIPLSSPHILWPSQFH